MKQQFYNMPALGLKAIGVKAKIALKDIVIEEVGPVSQTPSRTKGPIEVIRDSQTGKYHLFDGQHRVKEAIQRGENEIDALVAKGDPVKGGGWNVSRIRQAVLSDASQAITASGINRFIELVKQGEPENFAYAAARREINAGFFKFIKSLNFKRPANANPNIPTIDLMRNDPKIGNLVKEAEKAVETGTRRLFILLKGQEGVAQANTIRATMGEPPIKTDDLQLGDGARNPKNDSPELIKPLT